MKDRVNTNKTMDARKRARTSAAGSDSATSTAAPLVELAGGEPCPSGLVQLWRSGRLPGHKPGPATNNHWALC